MNQFALALTKRLIKLNFAISLLLLIAISSVLGTFIEQNKSLDFYQLNYSQEFFLNIPVWKVLTFLGMDHIYSTYWFILLICILVTSLALCSIKTQFPALKLAKIVRFQSDSYIVRYAKEKNLPVNLAFSELTYKLSKRKYQTIQQGYSSYSYRGILGRIAPIIVHVSLVIILVGAVLGNLFGFTAQQMIPQGEVSHLQNIINSSIFSKIPQQANIQINHFSIEYYDNGSISQYYTDISFLNSRLERTNSRVISVNHPLKFSNFTFYQTDWELSAIRVTFNEKDIYELPLKKIKLQGKDSWSCSLPIAKNKDLILLTFDTQNQYHIYNSTGDLIHKDQLGNPLLVDDTYFRIIDNIPSTGLQIKADPGIFLVYSGFLLLMMSLLMAYLSYNQIWGNQIKGQMHLIGKNNRAKLQLSKSLQLIFPDEIL
uniref:Cytochrome c biogenesis protein CcsB n=1 Tax=Gronococcus sybilensis TaxID=3028029 RepID=A0A9Y1I2I0_9RHOD|nr:c-type cytochrome biogenensis protein [Gronococcus sybilensis]